MDLLDETIRDWNELSDFDQAKILKRIEELAASGTRLAIAIATKVGVKLKLINVPMDTVPKDDGQITL
jgi:hypothetical protein